MRDDTTGTSPEAEAQLAATSQLASNESGALLERILDESPVVDWRMRTAGQRIVEFSANDMAAILEIREPSGAVSLSVTLDEGGVRLRIDARHVEIHAGDHLTLASRQIRLAAAERLELVSGGNIQQSAGKAVVSRAFEHDIEAIHGEIRLTANDDIALDGERIRLNSPNPAPPPQPPKSDG